MEEKLKPCPFCGDEAQLWRNWNRRSKVWFYYCKCELCGAQSTTITSSDPGISEPDWKGSDALRARRAWNRRAS